MLEALGGRKFIMGIVTTAAGCAVHVLSPKGLTPELVALLLGVSGGFSITNLMATKDALKFGTAPASSSADEDDSTTDVAAVAAVTAQVSGNSGELENVRAQVEQLAAAQGAILQSVANTNKLLVAALGQKQG